MYVTVPSPVPLAPAIMENHEESLDAVQEQLVDVLTISDPVPPLRVPPDQ